MMTGKNIMILNSMMLIQINGESGSLLIGLKNYTGEELTIHIPAIRTTEILIGYMNVTGALKEKNMKHLPHHIIRLGG